MIELTRQKARVAFLGLVACLLVCGIVLGVTKRDTATKESDLLAGNGKVITSGFSERIKIPQPNAPKIVRWKDRTNCPHQPPSNAASALLDWHDASTWPNRRIPRAGDDVTLPVNRRVVIRKSVTSRLGIITIPINSTLVLGEAAEGAGIQLNTQGIDVRGSLVAGSETCPIISPISIILHGTRPADAVTNRRTETYKGISVHGGTLSLHGKRFFRTWTRLSQTVRSGSKILYLQDAVNWEVGQKIVLVTTAVKDSREWHQNEVLTITKVQASPAANVKTAIHVSSPLRHTHLANAAYQAEVGLLTRTIAIQGSAADSEPTDPDPKTCNVTEGNERFSDRAMPCPYKEITGFGGHVIVHGKTGKAYVEGVEFYRMGQTNVLGRYPIHFHLLGNSCPGCYVRASSFHHSFYRCVAIHGTHRATVTENVAYDVTGYCFYLEDGVEENNTLSFNLAAHIHIIADKPPGPYGQDMDPIAQSARLTLPADVAASGFYITNVRNNVIGNAASGGWAGFAFPTLRTPLNTFRNLKFRPSSVPALTIDGNSAHSTGWWWEHGCAFYFGGDLYYNANNVLEYNPGRSGTRSPCKVNACELGDCDYGCPLDQTTAIRITNSKAFLVAGIGLNSWSGEMEVVGWESHDTGLALESLSEGFWIDNALVVCRTGEALALPTVPDPWARLRGDGFIWYDTAQEHIITNALFRNCGYRSDEYNQYDASPDRGCGDSDANGCTEQSTVFGFLTHSDEFTPEIMQGTRAISFEKCGRRFSLDNFADVETVSGRGQNWLDVDGSASGRGVPTLMVSAAETAKKWWTVDDKVGYDPQGPLRFIDIQPRAGAPQRGLGHFDMKWDDALQKQVGISSCGNGDGTPCPVLGYVRHAGRRFSNATYPGLAITARGDIVGPVGGYGWIVKLQKGAPRTIRFGQIEVLPETPMLVSIAYPKGSTFKVFANASQYCWSDSAFSCTEIYSRAQSIAQVRNGPGNQYFVDKNGVLTLRIVQLPQGYIGRPEWFIPSRTDPGEFGGFALKRFERSGVFLPISPYESTIVIEAQCGGTGPYCSPTPAAHNYDPDICPTGFAHQLGYDFCCATTNPAGNCVFASSR